MGNFGSIPASAVGEAKACTQLDQKDLQRLRRRFQRLVGDSYEASLQQFSTMPEVVGNPYIPRLFDLMDTDKNGSISFLEFCVGISMYQELQKTDDGKLQLLFHIHDADNDGKLSKTELADLMRMSAGKPFDEEQLQEMVKMIMEVYDQDNDDALGAAEFSQLAATCGESLKL